MRILKKYHLPAIVLMLAFLSSCSNRILYMQDIYIPPDTLSTNYKSYRLKPYDYLYISIKTTDKDVNTLFSEYLQSMNIRNSNMNQNNYYLTGYMINDSGYVFLPIFGWFHLQGLTVEQAQNVIQQRIDSVLNGALVKVKLISFEINFIGEVNQTLNVYKDKINILEALSMVGGLPSTADKKQIYILRRIDSAYKVIPLDLTTKKIIENKNFYLQPNDIIYVKPRKAAVAQIQIRDYFIFVSLITSTISLITFFLTLKR